MTNFERFEFTLLKKLPRLAWCARIRDNHPIVSVYHGPWVERDEQCFYEGAWSGELTQKNFDTAITFSGSGARLAKAVVFSTSTHTLEPVHLLRLPNEILCSNSIHFLLAESGDSISTEYLYYDADMMTIMFGTNNYIASVPTANGHTIEQFYHCNFSILPDLHIEKHEKPAPASFKNFNEYASFLFAETSKLTQNAMHPARDVKYEPLTTISTGYDSPACAVLGKAAGCTKALTFTTARKNFRDREDSGKPIAEILNLELREYDAFSYIPEPHYPEAEFIATGHGGDDVVLAPAEDSLSAKLLYTGYHGDRVWARHNKQVNSHIVRGDTSGCSLAEFRLRTGFINIPVPFIGCVRHPSIHRISNSAEMGQWSVGGDYDRPIPRRIVEEAGVPRSLFGQNKKAITTPYQSNRGKNPPMDRILSENSYKDFLDFARPIKRYKSMNHKLRYDFMHALYVINLRAVQSGKLKRALSMVWLKGPSEVAIPWKFSKPRTNNSLAFHWAAGKMRPRYQHDNRARTPSG